MKINLFGQVDGLPTVASAANHVFIKAPLVK